MGPRGMTGGMDQDRCYAPIYQSHSNSETSVWLCSADIIAFIISFPGMWLARSPAGTRSLQAPTCGRDCHQGCLQREGCPVFPSGLAVEPASQLARVSTCRLKSVRLPCAALIARLPHLQTSDFPCPGPQVCKISCPAPTPLGSFSTVGNSTCCESERTQAQIPRLR